jgi:hypothetical protein
MTEEALPVSTVTPIKGVSATVVPLMPESVESEPAQPEAVTATTDAALASPSAVAQSLTAEATTPKALALRLQHLTSHTLPIAWYRIARVGPAGLIGGAAVLAAVLIAALAVVGARHATDTLSAQIAHAQVHPGQLVTGDSGVSQVVAALPRRQEMPAVVGLVLEQARAANVTLDNGHYTYSVPKGGNAVGRYELEFPVKASYPNVRDFINRTLSAVPAAGLDKLRIERKVVGDPMVSADIRFVVFVRAGP